MSALSDLVKYAQIGDVIYKRGEHNQPYSRANEAAADLAALRARLAELACPECDSRVMDNGYCMLGHWCGKPLK
jgi:hypothetical protein